MISLGLRSCGQFYFVNAGFRGHQFVKESAKNTLKISEFQLVKMVGRVRPLHSGAPFTPPMELTTSQIQESRDVFLSGLGPALERTNMRGRLATLEIAR